MKLSNIRRLEISNAKSELEHRLIRDECEQIPMQKLRIRSNFGKYHAEFIDCWTKIVVTHEQLKNPLEKRRKSTGRGQQNSPLERFSK